MGKVEIKECNNCGSQNIKFPEDLYLAICLDCKYLTKIYIESEKCDSLSFLIWNKLYKGKKVMGE